jgi:hypothetical protein
MRKLVFSFATVALLVLAGAAQAATKPEPVTLTGTLVFPESPPATGTFTATGPICPSGTIQELGGLFVGWQSDRLARIGVRHEFTCADGSGSFVLQLTVRLNFEDGTTDFRWSVLSGSGDYAKLHGTGTGTGAPIAGGIVDTYTGEMHID